MVRASTRLPRSARTAAAAVVCTSASSTSIRRFLSSSASCERERVVVLATNGSLCPLSRSRRTASAAPGIGSPDTCRTPSTSRRIAAIRLDSTSVRVTRSVVLPLSEVEFRTSRSSGPGGQHAQKTETRVEAVFDVEASSALSAAQKRRVLAKAGPLLRAVAQDERSQLRNRELALGRLVAALREALRVERRRVPTRPSAASRRRRLEGKGGRGHEKARGR